jgi:hypothetical protein
LSASRTQKGLHIQAHMFVIIAMLDDLAML